jgi:hypothetical protein
LKKTFKTLSIITIFALATVSASAYEEAYNTCQPILDRAEVQLEIADKSKTFANLNIGVPAKNAYYVATQAQSRAEALYATFEVCQEDMQILELEAKLEKAYAQKIGQSRMTHNH